MTPFAVFIASIAGIGAGVGTGLAGLSAAAVISPMLITFLHIPAYEAVGIALASDVLASAASAVTYGRNRHLDIRNGLVMLASVLLFTLIGSLIASFLPHATMGGFSVLMTLVLGIRFLVRPVMNTQNLLLGKTRKARIIQSLICGSVIGFICGFMGAGGGMMMLLLLTSVLGYELKTAVGTSVFIMTFTAFTGAASHFAIGGAPPIPLLAVCVLVTLIAAQISAKFANKAHPKVLNQVTGGVLTVLGIVMILVHFWGG